MQPQDSDLSGEEGLLRHGAGATNQEYCQVLLLSPFVPADVDRATANVLS